MKKPKRKIWLPRSPVPKPTQKFVVHKGKPHRLRKHKGRVEEE